MRSFTSRSQDFQHLRTSSSTTVSNAFSVIETHNRGFTMSHHVEKQQRFHRHDSYSHHYEPSHAAESWLLFAVKSLVCMVWVFVNILLLVANYLWRVACLIVRETWTIFKGIVNLVYTLRLLHLRSIFLVFFGLTLYILIMQPELSITWLNARINGGGIYSYPFPAFGVTFMIVRPAWTGVLYNMKITAEEFFETFIPSL